MKTERLIVRMESERNCSCDEYFQSRPNLIDTTSNAKLFEAGFERGFWAAVEYLKAKENIR